MNATQSFAERQAKDIAAEVLEKARRKQAPSRKDPGEEAALLQKAIGHRPSEKRTLVDSVGFATDYV